MGKIQYIKKARKEHKCSKCGNTIKVGEPYKKGVINFRPDIIVCDNCKLKSYEVTTSEYTKSVGAIVEDWSEEYSLLNGGVTDEIADALDEIRNDVESALDNIPENLRDSSSSGELLQSRLEQLEEVIDALHDIDEDVLREEAEAEVRNDINEDEYEDSKEYEADVQEQVDTLFEENLSAAIDEALSSLEY